MGDAGEGLVDAESRIQERLKELAREKADRQAGPVADPEAERERASLRLARTALQVQLDTANDPRRRAQLTQAVADLDKKLK